MTALRSPDTVMRLSRLGAAHQTRLSFMRVLLRRMKQARWRFDRPVWEIDSTGVGHAVYRAIGPDHTYSLVAFAHDLPDHLRSDRVIAEAWDATFVLVDGKPTEADLRRLAREVPKQEAGRISDRELVLSRANRSVRLWQHVVERLAAGRQPDPVQVDAVGYLMRTTAVYGSGKFGAADFRALSGRNVLGGPFRAEMLTVWLIRAFSLDLVEHIARQQGGAQATVLDQDTRRQVGIGNSTGLGMAPFLVNHPMLLDAWIRARETAIARVRALPRASAKERAAFLQIFERAAAHLETWQTAHGPQMARVARLREDVDLVRAHLGTGALRNAAPWEALYQWAEESLSVEGQEWIAALMLEPYGELIDALADEMSLEGADMIPIDGTWSLGRLAAALAETYGWALDLDPTAPEASDRFWYVSEAKLEPRLGQRHDEPGADREQPLDIAHQIAALARDLRGLPRDGVIADLLAERPEHRRIVRRIQMAETAPYAEIRDNLVATDLQPIDMLRCKLAFFGATRFDPRSDRWVRITMYQGAPCPQDLADLTDDAWALAPARDAAADPVA